MIKKLELDMEVETSVINKILFDLQLLQLSVVQLKLRKRNIGLLSWCFQFYQLQIHHFFLQRYNFHSLHQCTFIEFRHLRNQHRLVFTISDHTSISVISDRVQMWRYFVLLLTTIVVHHLHGVYRQSLVRIDGHTKQT